MSEIKKSEMDTLYLNEAAIETESSYVSREVVMFPRSIVPLFVGREASIKAIESAISTYGKKIFLVAQRESEQEKPDVDDLLKLVL